MLDVVVFIQRDDSAVHPAFKFGDEGQAGVGMVEQGVNDGVFKIRSDSKSSVSS